MYSNLVLSRRLQRLSCLCRYSTVLEGQRQPTSTTASDGISPPIRIPRSPTDILEALAATIGTDPTAPHYKYHDDPYLIPLSNFRKRAYALSAEAGRKAAAWVRDEHAEWFTTRVWDPPTLKKTPYFNADPQIPAFAPKPIYNEESKVTESDLEYTIKNALVQDAIKVFQLLGGAESINDKLKLDFLQLLCFYNEREPDSMEWLEEKWFVTSTRERPATTWRLGGLADKLFQSIEPKTSEAYCCIIQGMAKYFQAEHAHKLAQEANERGIQLSTPVYNSLISCIGFLKEGASLRTETLRSVLQEMHKNNITPNNETLSACLKSISAWGRSSMLQQMALEILAEFKVLGIRPGLTAYYYLLCLFCHERGPQIDILSNIMDDLEKRDSLEAVEPTDTNFFITAMGVCNTHLKNINMADRVHALLLKDNNYKLVGDAYKESIYYRHLITINCKFAPFEKTTELIDTLIPNIYVPEPSVMEEIINVLELNNAGDRLAQAWSQLVIFGHAKRINLVEKLLQAMCNCYHLQDEEIQAKMRATATELFKYGQAVDEKLDRNEMRSPAPKMSATAYSNIIELCSDAKDKSDSSWETVSEAMMRLNKDAIGVPTNPNVLADVAKKAAEARKQGVAATIITYLSECGFQESSTACVDALSVILNRSKDEVNSILSQPRDELVASLHPSALALFDAYHSVGCVDADSTSIKPNELSTSDSDSDTDGSDSD